MLGFSQLTDANFTTEVLQSPVPVLVFFSAVHCAPCKRLTPLVAQLAEARGGRIKAGHLDIHDDLKVALRHGVLKAPTLILFVKGKAVERVMGFMPKDKLAAKFEPHLS